jgi:hypothetical protein
MKPFSIYWKCSLLTFAAANAVTLCGIGKYTHHLFARAFRDGGNHPENTARAGTQGRKGGCIKEGRVGGHMEEKALL